MMEDAARRRRTPEASARQHRAGAPSALPAEAEGASQQMHAYTTDRTPDSAPKLVAAADVDSHRSLRCVVFFLSHRRTPPKD